jgi:hypothetical protein
MVFGEGAMVMVMKECDLGAESRALDARGIVNPGDKPASESHGVI